MKSLKLEHLRPDGDADIYHLKSVRRFHIGRGSACEIRILDMKMSRKHCAIERIDDAWMLIDLGSTNGVLVDGERVHGQVPLRHASKLAVGNTTLKVLELDAEADDKGTRYWVERRKASDMGGYGTDSDFVPDTNAIANTGPLSPIRDSGAEKISVVSASQSTDSATHTEHDIPKPNDLEPMTVHALEARTNAADDESTVSKADPDSKGDTEPGLQVMSDEEAQQNKKSAAHQSRRITEDFPQMSLPPPRTSPLTAGFSQAEESDEDSALERTIPDAEAVSEAKKGEDAPPLDFGPTPETAIISDPNAEAAPPLDFGPTPKTAVINELPGSDLGQAATNPQQEDTAAVLRQATDAVASSTETANDTSDNSSQPDQASDDEPTENNPVIAAEDAQETESTEPSDKADAAAAVKPETKPVTITVGKRPEAESTSTSSEERPLFINVLGHRVGPITRAVARDLKARELRGQLTEEDLSDYLQS